MNLSNILLIEDSESEAKVFELGMREAAPLVKVYWVATAEEGIEYLHQQGQFHDVSPVDLIVCDLNMPRVSGFEFIAKVRQQSGGGTRLTPIVAYSGSSLSRDVHQAYAYGASSYVVKAMTLETVVRQLRAMVHYWLEVVTLPSLVG
jgi:CheY-like chemotaxis protein